MRLTIHRMALSSLLLIIIPPLHSHCHITLASFLLLSAPLRLGLDAGGGTGSFAARMALYNVTIMTSAMNLETVQSHIHGLPYMETIASRGLIPLWLPHKVWRWVILGGLQCL